MDLLTSSVKDFVAATASKEPTPGGGAIAALTAATGAALAEMVANLTFDKKGYEDVQEEMHLLQQKAEFIREKALSLAQADANVFNLPKNTDEEKLARTAAIQQAYKDAANVPLEIGMISYEIFDLAYVAATKGNQNLITDGIIAAINARAAVKAAFLNVRINISGIKDESYVADLKAQMNQIESELDEKEASVLALYK